MKFGMVNKSTILNRFVLHTQHRNITHSAVITRKTNIKFGILKGGNWKRAIPPNNPSNLIIKADTQVSLFVVLWIREGL